MGSNIITDGKKSTLLITEGAILLPTTGLHSLEWNYRNRWARIDIKQRRNKLNAIPIVVLSTSELETEASNACINCAAQAVFDKTT